MVHAVVSGGLAGLLSLVHCAAMCGPLAALACKGQRGTGGALRYQAGRVVSYAFAGSVAARLGQALETPRFAVAPNVLALTGAAALALLALAALKPFDAEGDGGDRDRAQLVQLRKPRARRWLQALASIIPREPLAYGALSVLLPCGALAAALLIAAGTASPLAGCVTMATFACTSGAGVLAGGTLLGGLARLRGRRAARTVAACLAAAALVLGALPLYRAHARSVGPTPPTTVEASCH